MHGGAMNLHGRNCHDALLSSRQRYTQGFGDLRAPREPPLWMSSPCDTRPCLSTPIRTGGFRKGIVGSRIDSYSCSNVPSGVGENNSVTVRTKRVRSCMHTFNTRPRIFGEIFLQLGTNYRPLNRSSESVPN